MGVVKDLVDKVVANQKAKREHPFNEIKMDVPSYDIDPRLPVQNRRGQHVVLISYDPTRVWCFSAKVIGDTSYVHSFIKNGRFHSEKAPSMNDLFNVSRETYREAFPNDKRFV